MRMLLKFLFGSGKYSGVAANLGLLIGRLGFGVMLALQHGIKKLPPSDRFIGGVGDMGFPAPVLFAWLATLAEFAGGLLMAAGLLTRPAAVVIAFNMCVAGLIRHAADPLQKKELAFVYLFFALTYLFVGAGRYSIDWLISLRKRLN